MRKLRVVVVCVAATACGAPGSWSPSVDGGFPPIQSDAGSLDAGGPDAEVMDAGEQDAGEQDAGSADAGEQDAGSFDAGLADAGAGDAGPGDAGRPDAGPPVAFTEVYEKIIHRYCILCHRAGGGLGGGNGGLDMSTADVAYTNLLGHVPPMQLCPRRDLIVIPGNPEGSLLYEKVHGTQPCGKQMPAGVEGLPGTPLSDADQQLIYNWVLDGAKREDTAVSIAPE